MNARRARGPTSTRRGCRPDTFATRLLGEDGQAERPMPLDKSGSRARSAATSRRGGAAARRAGDRDRAEHRPPRGREDPEEEAARHVRAGRGHEVRRVKVWPNRHPSSTAQRIGRRVLLRVVRVRAKVQADSGEVDARTVDDLKKRGSCERRTHEAIRDAEHVPAVYLMKPTATRRWGPMGAALARGAGAMERATASAQAKRRAQKANRACSQDAAPPRHEGREAGRAVAPENIAKLAWALNRVVADWASSRRPRSAKPSTPIARLS